MYKRFAIVLAFTLAILLALSACAIQQPPAVEMAPAIQAASEGPTVESSTTAVTETVSDDGYSVTIEHEGGKTVLTSPPQRVVVLEYSYADALFVLGVEPIGYADDGVPAYLLERLKDTDAVPVGTRNEPNLETISTLQPELINADVTRHSTSFEVLNQIAPTLMYDSYRGSFENQIAILESLGTVFQKEDVAQTAIADAYDALEEAQRLVVGHERKVAVGVLAATGLTAHSSESFKGSLLAYLGLPTELEPQNGEVQFLVNLETIAHLAPQAIVVTCSPDDRVLWDEWTAQPVWQQLDAVQNDHVYVFNRDLWSKSRGLIALQLILRDARESGLLTGDPSTSTTCPDPVVN